MPFAADCMALRRTVAILSHILMDHTRTRRGYDVARRPLAIDCSDRWHMLSDSDAPCDDLIQKNTAVVALVVVK